LIIAPTREIALQIRDVIRAIGFFYQNLSVQVFIGLPLRECRFENIDIV
jgi:superfamily II DNA/RNA helicase